MRTHLPTRIPLGRFDSSNRWARAPEENLQEVEQLRIRLQREIKQCLRASLMDPGRERLRMTEARKSEALAERH